MTPADLIRVWELGQLRPNWQRALLLLAPQFPDQKPSQLSALTVGERNAHLLASHAKLSGNELKCLVRCPVCRETLEFGEEVSAFLEGYTAPESREETIEADGFIIQYRLIDSTDLAAAAEQDDVAHAREELIRRSICGVYRDGVTVPIASLSDTIIALLADELAMHDPLSATRIALSCLGCGHVWKAGFDIVTFMWAEIDLRAKRLLEEVRMLARHYGWDEADILAMSDARRHFYLEAVP